jgi:hypothetical protein
LLIVSNDRLKLKRSFDSKQGRCFEMLALWPKDFHAAPVELRCLSFERPVHHCRGSVLTGDAALFLPKRLLYLIENIRARQTNVCQIPFIEAFQFVSGPDTPPPHREQFLRFIPKPQATQSGYTDSGC